MLTSFYSAFLVSFFAEIFTVKAPVIIANSFEYHDTIYSNLYAKVEWISYTILLLSTLCQSFVARNLKTISACRACKISLVELTVQKFHIIYTYNRKIEKKMLFWLLAYIQCKLVRSWEWQHRNERIALRFDPYLHAYTTESITEGPPEDPNRSVQATCQSRQKDYKKESAFVGCLFLWHHT